MKLSDKEFIKKENEESYKLGNRHCLIVGFVAGITTGILMCIGYFFWQASQV